MTDLEERIHVLDLEGADVLLVEVPGFDHSPADLQLLRRQLQDLLALRGLSTPVLVHGPGLRFTIVKDPAGVLIAQALEEEPGP